MDKQKIFEELFLPLQEQALGFALSLTKNRTAAEDLFQETALKAFDKLEQFKPDSSPKAWFYTIMRNLFINDYRKKKKTTTVELDNVRLNSLVATENSKQISDEDGLNDVLSDEVRQALLALEESPRTVFLLYAVHQFPYKEIAEITATPIGTIKSSINRTKGKLYLRLQEIAEKEYGISST